MKIEQIIENIYSDFDLLSEESNNIWDYSRLFQEVIFKTNSRYRISGVNYKPYIITPELISQLNKKLIIVPSLGNKSQNTLIEYDNNTAVLYNITLESLPIYDGDLTPSGLFNVRLGTACGNIKLFERVKNDLMKSMTSINCGFNNYWIPNNKLNFLDCEEPIRSLVIKSIGYSWKL